MRQARRWWVGVYLQRAELDSNRDSHQAAEGQEPPKDAGHELAIRKRHAQLGVCDNLTKRVSQRWRQYARHACAMGTYKAGNVAAKASLSADIEEEAGGGQKHQ